MAAIDKIYGSYEDYLKIKEFLELKRGECIKVTGRDPMNYLYNPDHCWKDTSKGGPITVFPESIDVYLYQSPDLIEPLKRGLEFQYGDEWKTKVINRVPPYDWSEWKYEVSTKFQFDWSGYKWKHEIHYNRIPLRGTYDVEAKYDGRYLDFAWGQGCTKKRGYWIIPDRYQLKKTQSYDWAASSTWGWGCKTMKSLKRWIRKQKFPRGTVLEISTGYVDGDFKVYCK